MKAIQIVSRKRGSTDVMRGFALDGEPRKKAAAVAAAEVLADNKNTDLRVEFLPDLNSEAQPINSINELKAAMRSTYR